MRRHIVLAFLIVAVNWITIRCPAAQQALQVAANVSIGIFGNRDAATGVADKKVGNPAFAPAFSQDAIDFSRDLKAAAGASREAELKLFCHMRRGETVVVVTGILAGSLYNRDFLNSAST